MSGAGVARGCGWQHLAVYINLTMFYLVGMPIAMLLGFKLKLYAKVTKTACQTNDVHCNYVPHFSSTINFVVVLF